MMLKMKCFVFFATSAFHWSVLSLTFTVQLEDMRQDSNVFWFNTEHNPSVRGSLRKPCFLVFRRENNQRIREFLVKYQTIKADL